jgi:hypothetical protein
MATTRAAWRALVRNELDDNDTTKLWADALLSEWLNEGIRDYARAFPLEATATLTTVADQAAYALPDGLVEVVRVEHPTNVFRVHQPRVGGDWRVTGDPWLVTSPRSPVTAHYAYDVWGATLELEPAPTVSGEAIGVRYVARRAEPADDSDALPLDDGDVELLTFYVCSRALFWISAQEAKRQAFERQRGADASELARAYRLFYAEGLTARRRGLSPRPRRLVPRDSE